MLFIINLLFAKTYRSAMCMLFKIYRLVAFAMLIIVMFGLSPLFIASDPAFGKSYSDTGSDPISFADGAVCIESFEPFIDPGYCAGLSIAYLEILNDQASLAIISETHVIDQLKAIHQQCHATDFNSAVGLGQTAFHRMLYYATPDRLNTRLGQCQVLLKDYRLSWPGDGGRGKD